MTVGGKPCYGAFITLVNERKCSLWVEDWAGDLDHNLNVLPTVW